MKPWQCFRQNSNRILTSQILLNIILWPVVSTQGFWMQRLSYDVFSQFREPDTDESLSASDILNDMRENMRSRTETILHPGSCPISQNSHKISCRARLECPGNRELRPIRSCRLPSRSLFSRGLDDDPDSIFDRGGYEGICCSDYAAPKRSGAIFGFSKRYPPLISTSPVPVFSSVVETSPDTNENSSSESIVDPLELARKPVSLTPNLDLVPYLSGSMADNASFGDLDFSQQGAFSEANLADLGIDCGRRELDYKMIRVGRIVGGDTAGFSDWPWMAMILNYGRPRCGGTLLSRQTVVTAAHCVSGNLLLYNLTVKIGMFNTNERQTLPFPPVTVEIERIYRHPFFDLSTLLNDIAILHLKEPVTFAPNILPACLASHEYPFSTPTYILGWGKEEENNTVYDLPDTLQAVTVPIISRFTCAQYFAAQGLANLIGQQHICACSEEGGKDACQGDSGGPMLLQNPDGRFELIGIISWGFGCGEPNVPGVYTNIYFFKRWIIDTIKNLEIASLR